MPASWRQAEGHINWCTSEFHLDLLSRCAVRPSGHPWKSHAIRLSLVCGVHSCFFTSCNTHRLVAARLNPVRTGRKHTCLDRHSHTRVTQGHVPHWARPPQKVYSLFRYL
eukprot:1157898-Pelagomonas_calceolata.AAC.15